MRFIFSFPLFAPASLHPQQKPFKRPLSLPGRSPRRSIPAGHSEGHLQPAGAEQQRPRSGGHSRLRPGSLVPAAPVMDFRKSLQALVTVTELLKQREIQASLL